MILLWGLLLFTAEAEMNKGCSVFELRGWVRRGTHELHLMVAEKTMSERKIPSVLKEEAKLSPYVNQYVAIKAQVKGKTVNHKTKFLKILEIRSEVPDPLSQNGSSTATLMNEVECER